MSLPHTDHGKVVAATIVTNDLAGHAALYGEYLGYREEWRGTVPPELAALWGAPMAAAAPMAVLRSAAGTESWLRLVEDPGAEPQPAMRTYGWSAMEVAVEDCDALEAGFRAGPWEILGAPADLSFTDAIRAMQVVGPMGEVFYLTVIKRPVPGFDLPTPEARVDRLFVHILGCDDAETARDFYAGLFDVPPGPAFDAVIRVVNRSHGLPPDHKIRLGTVTLGGKSLVEIDRFPEGTTARPAGPLGLLPATSVASYYAASLDSIRADWLAQPARIDLPSWEGRRTGCLLGPAGERVELLEIG